MSFKRVKRIKKFAWSIKCDNSNTEHVEKGRKITRLMGRLRVRNGQQKKNERTNEPREAPWRVCIAGAVRGPSCPPVGPWGTSASYCRHNQDVHFMWAAAISAAVARNQETLKGHLKKKKMAGKENWSSHSNGLIETFYHNFLNIRVLLRYAGHPADRGTDGRR